MDTIENMVLSPHTKTSEIDLTGIPDEVAYPFRILDAKQRELLSADNPQGAGLLLISAKRELFTPLTI